MNSTKFKRPSKQAQDFVSGGVEIEDTHKRAPSAAQAEEVVRMQVILTKPQREWLRRKAFDADTQMSKILRALIDEAMGQG